MGDPLDRSHTAPKFAAPDPGALAAWYAEHLGFPEKAVFDEGRYAIVRRGTLTLHFWQCDDRNIAENTACYTEIRDVDALDELQWTAGGVHIAQNGSGRTIEPEHA